jgi:hypothetical protein
MRTSFPVAVQILQNGTRLIQPACFPNRCSEVTADDLKNQSSGSLQILAYLEEWCLDRPGGARPSSAGVERPAVD